MVASEEVKQPSAPLAASAAAPGDSLVVAGELAVATHSDNVIAAFDYVSGDASHLSIAAGEPLTFNYLSVTLEGEPGESWSVQRRRDVLMEKMGFECGCSRCVREAREEAQAETAEPLVDVGGGLRPGQGPCAQGERRVGRRPADGCLESSAHNAL